MPSQSKPRKVGRPALDVGHNEYLTTTELKRILFCLDETMQPQMAGS
jgi:hypothetical protein